MFANKRRNRIVNNITLSLGVNEPKHTKSPEFCLFCYRRLVERRVAIFPFSLGPSNHRQRSDAGTTIAILDPTAVHLPRVHRRDRAPETVFRQKLRHRRTISGTSRKRVRE